jgi:glycine/D-amino acid oxidase-like deaminating enzyme
MAKIDITVRGAGIFGLSLAWVCHRRGATVQVIDPGGVAAGASGGIVGALAPHTPDNWNPKKQFQFESLLQAETFWADVDGTSGLSSGYGRTGRVQPVLSDRGLELAHSRHLTAKDHWRGLASWDVHDADAAEWMPISPTGKIILDTLTARVHPKRGCLSIAEALRSNGVSVSTTGEDQGKTVWATGLQGLLDLSSSLQAKVGVGVKGQAVLLDYAAPTNAPQIFADGLHIIPHADGTVAVGSTSERDYTDPKTTDVQLEALLDKAIQALPVLIKAPVLQRWAGVRPRAASRAPVMGSWPKRPEHFVLNGGFKIGFGMAPKLAEVMADLLLTGEDHIPDAFRLDACL